MTRPELTTAAQTVLVCEDDENLRTLVRLALGDGYRIIEAADGNEALELIRAERPGLIVLDLMLPGRSGLDVLKAIRHENGSPRTRVIVISAWSHSDEAAVAAGADRFMAKPFDPDDLQTMVADLLTDDGNGG